MKYKMVVIAAVLALALAVPTAAISLEDDSSGEVQFEPTSQYADIEDGKLVLDFEGLNEDAVTSVDELFTVEAGDDRIAHLWIAPESDGLTFYRTGDRTDEIDDDDPLTFETDDPTGVGISIDTEMAMEGSSTITLTVAYDDGDGTPPPAPPMMPSPDPPAAEEGESDDEPPTVPSLVDLEVTPLEIAAGESVTVTGTYEGGDRDEDVTAALTVDGIVVSQQTVTVPADSTTTVTFERTLEEPGTIPVGIGDETRDVEVSAVETAEPAANITVSNASLNTEQIQPGQSVTLTANVTNSGEVAGERTFDVVVGGFVVQTVTVDLEAGETETVVLERTFKNAGTYSLAFGGVDAGSVTVVAPTLVSASVTELPSRTGVALSIPILFGFGLLFSRRMGWT